MEQGIEIKGVEKASLLDYPDKVCATIFLPGCNFRCGFCHNPDLINSPDKLPDVPEGQLFSLLSARGKWLDAVCITGGEPTLHPGLPGLIKRVKDKGFLVKLDTNGTNPRMLEQLLRDKLLDYMAMDIKGPLEKYAEISGAPVDIRKIEQSIGIIRESGIGYEFRSTVLPRIITESDLRKMGEWLKGSKRFALQQFKPLHTLDPEYEKEQPYSRQDMERFKNILQPYFDEVEVRGL